MFKQAFLALHINKILFHSTINCCACMHHVCTTQTSLDHILFSHQYLK